MSKAAKGDTVEVHYTGKLEDGTEFDSSQGKDPIEFEIGAGNIIPGLENAVIGMKEGDKKTEKLGPEDAYGEYSKEYVLEVEKDQIPSDMDVEKGQQLELQLENDQTIPVMVREVKEKKVVLDANHPLAGKNLVFDIELVSVDKG